MIKLWCVYACDIHCNEGQKLTFNSTLIKQSEKVQSICTYILHNEYAIRKCSDMNVEHIMCMTVYKFTYVGS